LATRWYVKKVKEINPKEEQIVQAALQDPRLNGHFRVNESLNDFYNQFTSNNTTQSQDGEDEYLISTRIVHPDCYYNQ